MQRDGSLEVLQVLHRTSTVIAGSTGRLPVIVGMPLVHYQVLATRHAQ